MCRLKIKVIHYFRENNLSLLRSIIWLIIKLKCIIKLVDFIGYKI